MLNSIHNRPNVSCSIVQQVDGHFPRKDMQWVILLVSGIMILSGLTLKLFQEWISLTSQRIWLTLLGLFGFYYGLSVFTRPGQVSSLGLSIYQKKVEAWMDRADDVLSYCRSCEHYRPLRAHHCRLNN